MTIRRLFGVAVLLCVGPTVRPAAAQCPDGSPPPCRLPRIATTPAPNSVAVLYFDNLSNDSAYAYLADALTEELIARLGDVPRLLVRSRFSVRRYKTRAAPNPAAAGRTLGVTFLVTGSVRPGRDRLRVSVELVRASSGIRVWGRVIDQPNVDLLVVTEMIARDVAQGIVGRLLPRERAALSLRLTASPEAYEHLARGNYFLAQRSARSAGRAIQEYESAVRLDSAFAGAHARLALAYVLAVINRLDVGLSQDSLMARFHDAINHARSRDSLSADVVLATALTGDLSDAPIEQAVQRDPDNAELQHMRGLQLAVQGDLIRASAALHQAVAIDPDRPITLGWLSVLAIAGGRFAEAKRWADSALALNPGFPGYAHRALVNLQLGDTVQARADAEAALRVSSGRGVGTASMALIQAATGDTAGAHVRIEELLGAPAAAAPSDEAWAYTIATLGLLGDTARAFDLLNGMTVLRYPNGTTVLRYVRLLLPLAVFDPLRNQPRFVRAIDASLPRSPQ